MGSAASIYHHSKSSSTKVSNDATDPYSMVEVEIPSQGDTQPTSMGSSYLGVPSFRDIELQSPVSPMYITLIFCGASSARGELDCSAFPARSFALKLLYWGASRNLGTREIELDAERMRGDS